MFTLPQTKQKMKPTQICVCVPLTNYRKTGRALLRNRCCRDSADNDYENSVGKKTYQVSKSHFLFSFPQSKP